MPATTAKRGISDEADMTERTPPNFAYGDPGDNPDAVLHHFLHHVDAEQKQQTAAEDYGVERSDPYGNGNEDDADIERFTRGAGGDPGLFKGELQGMQDLLPDGRAGPALYPCNGLPVYPP